MVEECPHTVVVEECPHAFVAEECPHTFVAEQCPHAFVIEECPHSLKNKARTSVVRAFIIDSVILSKVIRLGIHSSPLPLSLLGSSVPVRFPAYSHLPSPYSSFIRQSLPNCSLIL